MISASTNKKPDKKVEKGSDSHGLPADSFCQNSSDPIPLSGSAAMNEIFRLHYSELVRFCRLRVRNPFEAEDIVQDAFLAVRRAYADKPIDELRALLFTTLRNLSFNHLKSRRVKTQDQADDIVDIAYRLPCERTRTPEQAAIEAQRLAIARQVIEQLKPRKRDALCMHRIDGLTHEEIAARLSVSATTVKTDIADAVAEIAEKIRRAESYSSHKGK